MLRNSLTVALRNLRNHAGYAFINIFGLGIGLAACVLILLYVQDERSYDRHHEHADAIYRVYLDAEINGRSIKSATSSAPMAAALEREYPDVVQSTRIWEIGRVLFQNGDRRFYEEGVIWADSTVFDVFTFPFLRGDPATALTEPRSVVLTESTARRYFGDEDPVGRVLRYENVDDYRVTGVVRDVPPNAHFRFDMLGSISSFDRAGSTEWLSNSFYTYVRLRPDADPARLEAKLPEFVRKYIVPQAEAALGHSFEAAVEAGMRYDFRLQPLTDIHLFSDLENDIAPQSDIAYVYILSAIALLILLIACINFTNLTTARAAGRAKEVGMRKALGSSRRQLIAQYLGESVLLALFATALTVVLLLVALPVFNEATGKALTIGMETVAALLGIALVVGLAAGLYPALVLSAFEPAVTLKSGAGGGRSGARMRRALVVAQFAISIALLTGTGVVYDQLRFMQQTSLGFQREQVVVVTLETQEARRDFPTFRDRLLALPGVVQVAAGTGIPGRFGNDTVFRPEGASSEQIYNFKWVSTTHEYFETLGIEVAAGRTFSREQASEADAAFMLNEAAVRELGWTPEEAVGKTFTQVGTGGDDADRVGRVIGVVRDFHYDSLHEPIRGLVMDLARSYTYYVPIRLQTSDLSGTLASIGVAFETFQPGYPFHYFFLDRDFGRLYEQEERLGRIYGAFALFALFVACLGLYGLASFVTAQRTKEIGVRKVMGASVASIVMLLSKEFARLVLIAALVAVPVAYLAMNRWLEDFAYRVGLHWYVFALAVLAALVVALTTMAYQTLRAATADPVESLRYE